MDNRLHSDFGCATAMDLAAMVADPRDLVEGRAMPPVVGDPAVFAVHRYRSGATAGPRGATSVYIPDSTTTFPSASVEPGQSSASASAAPAAASTGAAVGASSGEPAGSSPASAPMSAAAKKGGPIAPGSDAASKGQFLAVIADEVTRETARAAALQLGWQNCKVREGGAEEALKLVQAMAAPSFLLVDVSGSADPLPVLEAISGLCRGETRVVAIGMVNDVGLYRRLMDLGVSDYLVKPVSAPVLAAAIETATQSPQRASDRNKAARVIAMIGARGGVGTTTVALSAAWTISQQRQNVVLLDLDLHFGSLALSLDLEPGRGLREILGNPERIDSLLIGAAMVTANDRLRIMSAEESLEDSLDMDHEGLAALLSDLSADAECIVVDLPRSLGPMTRHVLAVAHVITIVTDQSLPAMRDTQRLLSLIRNMRLDARLVVAANRVGGVAGEVGRADFERGIGTKISYAIPYDAKAAAAAAEQAKPFVETAKAGKAGKELEFLALGLAGAPAPAAQSLLQRILGK